MRNGFIFNHNRCVDCNACSAACILENGWTVRRPACSTACPTGALTFGQLSDTDFGSVYSWFPDKKLNPAIEFTSNKYYYPLRVIPEEIQSPEDIKQNKKGKNISGELSLIIFSFLATISVATIITSFIGGVFPDRSIFISVLVIAGIVSFFHLGRIIRSWRSVINLRNSPLSREIVAFIVYAGVSSLTVLLRFPALLIASSIIGLIFLLLIDNVYIYTDRKKTVILHSGQTFLSALIIVSFISGIVLPFVFMALIKLVLVFYRLVVNKLNSSYFTLRFLRIVFLVVPGMSLILHNSKPDNFIIIIFLIGELLDRILFYIDFNPLNINTLIDEQLNLDRNEKKRG